MAVAPAAVCLDWARAAPPGNLGKPSRDAPCSDDNNDRRASQMCAPHQMTTSVWVHGGQRLQMPRTHIPVMHCNDRSAERSKADQNGGSVRFAQFEDQSHCVSRAIT